MITLKSTNKYSCPSWIQTHDLSVQTI